MLVALSLIFSAKCDRGEFSAWVAFSGFDCAREVSLVDLGGLRHGGRISSGPAQTGGSGVVVEKCTTGPSRANAINSIVSAYSVTAGFADGPKVEWPVQVRNLRTAEDAIAWARGEVESDQAPWGNLCLAFVARAYKWDSSGVRYAVDHYRQMPAEMQNDKDRNPPPGALLYWDTGQRAGHVALYLGNGKIASNDIVSQGRIDIVDATVVESKWGATYIGWAPPYFPLAGR
ncbi:MULTISPECIES: NlpC/P60 family protein [Streptomyces]|nr:NlpC/P60 family protein [Streptomyces virginiae]